MNASALDRETPAPALNARAVTIFHAAAFAGLMLVALVMGLWRLESFPAPWFDEGWWLQVPRNIALYGEYATRSAEGFRYHDTVLSASPVFFLPIAAVFKVVGVGLLQARLVIVAYFLASCVVAYLLTRRLSGPFAALFTLALFIFVVPADTFTSPLLLGRQVMGEVPALFFLLAGMLAWVIAVDRRSAALAALAGVLCGFAISVKSQFGLIALPMWIALAVVDFAYYRQRRVRLFAAPLIAAASIVALHQLLLFLAMGATTYATFIGDIRDASGPQVRVFLSWPAMLNAGKLLARSEYSILLFPALVYAIALCAKRSPDNIKLALPTMFVTGWLLWFVLASVGWARYAFPAFAVSFILAGRLVADLGGFGNAMLSRARKAWSEGDPAPTARAVAVGVMFLISVIVMSQQAVQGVFTGGSDTARQFAAYLDASVPADKRIATWEWEIASLAGEHDFLIPPTPLLTDLIAEQQLGASVQRRPYSPADQRPDYIVIGPFAKWTRLFDAAYLERSCVHVKSIGQYDLCQVVSLGDATLNRV